MWAKDVEADKEGRGRSPPEGQAVLLLPLGDKQGQVPAAVPMVAGPAAEGEELAVEARMPGAIPVQVPQAVLAGQRCGHGRGYPVAAQPHSHSPELHPGPCAQRPLPGAAPGVGPTPGTRRPPLPRTPQRRGADSPRVSGARALPGSPGPRAETSPAPPAPGPYPGAPPAPGARSRRAARPRGARRAAWRGAGSGAGRAGRRRPPSSAGPARPPAPLRLLWAGLGRSALTLPPRPARPGSAQDTPRTRPERAPPSKSPPGPVAAGRCGRRGPPPASAQSASRPPEARILVPPPSAQAQRPTLTFPVRDLLCPSPARDILRRREESEEAGVTPPPPEHRRPLRGSSEQLCPRRAHRPGPCQLRWLPEWPLPPPSGQPWHAPAYGLTSPDGRQLGPPGDHPVRHP